MRTLIITIIETENGFTVSRTVEGMSPYEIIGACNETIRDIHKQLDNPKDFTTTKRTRITPTEEIDIASNDDYKDFLSD